MSAKFDGLLADLGTGTWQWLYFVANSYWSMMLVPHTLASVFLAPAVGHTCRYPDPAEPIVHDNTTDQCQYQGVSNGSDVGVSPLPCTSWDYDNTTFTNTITIQFDLVCESEYLRATYQSMYMIGSFIGAPINGMLSDRYGRHMVVTVGSVVYTIMGLFMCWLPSFPAILVGRFIMGFMHPAGLQAGYILAMEVCEPRFRARLGMILGLPWSVGAVLWAGWAYGIRDWQYLQLAVSLPCLLFFPLWWFADESPRWLIVRGHHERARKVLEKAARWNKKELPPPQELDALMESIMNESRGVREKEKARQEQQQTNQSTIAKVATKAKRVFVLCSTRRLCTTTFLIYIKFAMVSLVYYGMSLNAVNFSVNTFLYMALGGLSEIPAYLLAVPLLETLGRKVPAIACYFMAGVSILSLAFIPSDISWLVMTLAMVGKLCIAVEYQIIYLFATELFPTEVRLLGLGTSTIASRISSISAPFITDFLGPMYPWGPSVVFGVAALVAGLATLPLPETSKTAMPDTVTDLDKTNHRAAADAEDGNTEMESLRTEQT